MLEKKNAGYKAAEYIKDHMIVGLGTGTTAYYLIERVGQLVQNGLQIKAVPTSDATAQLAKERHIPIVSIDTVDRIDLAIDGVDEIDSRFNAIKGRGGALFREKMIASIADDVIWIMDSSKAVDILGTAPLPIEVLPYGYTHILKKLKSLLYRPILRMNDGSPFLTDNNNYIIDLHLNNGFDIANVSATLKNTPGILETGLFVNTCNKIIVGHGDRVTVIENPFKHTNQ